LLLLHHVTGKTTYWDERYTKDPEPFDWYQRYSGVRDLINQYVKREDVILMAGCGNSRLTEDMFEDGYTTITNVDVSRVVIDQMLEKYKDKPTLQWQQMNVCALDFPDETFDVVIAKATVDAVLCGEGSTANVAKLCSEVSRVLKVCCVLTCHLLYQRELLSLSLSLSLTYTHSLTHPHPILFHHYLHHYLN